MTLVGSDIELGIVPQQVLHLPNGNINVLHTVERMIAILNPLAPFRMLTY
jgi:hypothetical protein